MRKGEPHGPGGISPLHLPHKGECSALVLGRVRPVGRIGPSRTGPTSPTRQSPNTDSCSFAPFVNIRGLKTSIEFPLFPSHEAHKAAHERERANNFPLSRANTIRLLADSLIASADSIRKPADRIRKMTKRIRNIFIKSSRKTLKSLKISTFRRISPDFSCLQNQKCCKDFGRKRRGELFSIFQKKASCQFFRKF